jgi:hypothetical protein
VHAQALLQNGPPPPAIRRPGKQPAPGVVAAQRFLLVDPAGNVFGVIGMNHDRPEIDLYDSNGNVVWRAPGHFGVTPTSE